MQKSTSGFTIVELLIVVVVIGILAAITVVAYGNVQARAQTNRTVTDLSAVNKAVNLYFVQNGSYPISLSWRSSFDYPGDYVPGLVPTFIAKLPNGLYPGDASLNEVYMYYSNGTDYKIIAHGGRYGNLCQIAKAQDAKLVSNRDCWAYGFYSPGGAVF